MVTPGRLAFVNPVTTIMEARKVLFVIIYVVVVVVVVVDQLFCITFIDFTCHLKQNILQCISVNFKYER